MTMNLYQKINEIKKKVAYVRKDKKVDTYMAVTHDAVTAETRQWFTEFGVLILTSELSSSMIDTGYKTKSGNPIFRFDAKYQITFVNIDAPEDRDFVCMTAHGIDSGDKAPGKTASYATKYAIMKILQLETGENDEARETSNIAPGEEVSAEELEAMLKPIKEAETEKALLDAFAPAFARAVKDKAAKDAIMQAKNARFIVLKAEAKKGGAK